ncbi:MAG: peptidylprolyl isomerase [Algibacter sp.]
MPKLLLNCLLLILTSAVMAQNSATEKELEILETLEQAETYLERKSFKKNKLVVFNEEKHKTTLAKKLFKSSVGGTEKTENEFEKIYYKVVEKTKTLYYRVAYIYLDGNRSDLKNVNNFRDGLIDKYNNSSPFDFLAKRHSMDKNATRGGDSGWFSKNNSNSTFETLIIDDNHDLDTIFPLDIPSESGYYVVLKTHEPKNISEIKVLKIVEPKD